MQSLFVHGIMYRYFSKFYENYVLKTKILTQKVEFRNFSFTRFTNEKTRGNNFSFFQRQKIPVYKIFM